VIKTPEMYEEEDLKKRKPIPWTLDKQEFPETMDSLKEAEKLLNKKLVIPPKPAPIKTAEAIPYHFDADADEDVVSTLNNAQVAEKEVYSGSWIGQGSEYTTKQGEKISHGKGFDVSSKKGKLVGGTKYTVDGAGDLAKKGVHDHSVKGYGWKGDGAEHRDWWNYLVKDKFDGMAATSVNTS
jgi:hypothetical protein